MTPNNGNPSQAMVAAGTEHSDGLGGALTRSAETTATAMAERQKAMVQARAIVAMQRPRNTDDAAARILRHCKRPGFAAVAEYARPVGKQQNEQTGAWEQKIAKGPSIRLIETAIQEWHNLDIKMPVVFDDAEKRIVEVSVLDLERNTAYSTEITISKRIERKSLKRGQKALGERVNSYGDTVYIVEASDDEVNVKQKAMESKAVRELGRRLLPGDVIEDAIHTARETVANADAQDPDAAKKRMISAFGDVNVYPKDLAAYLGHALDTISPAELTEMRSYFTAIRDGETTWAAIVAGHSDVVDENPAPKPDTSAPLKDKLKEQAAAGKAGGKAPRSDTNGD